MLYVKTMVCSVAINFLEIPLILHPVVVTTESVQPMHMEIFNILLFFKFHPFFIVFLPKLALFINFKQN